ncbi:MipA/OmpV family protein [Massilia glaciei]|uniref:MipA/OmpV family protein n=1 Tax=Massilia glaciei TaxID=1524097 RepID=A0A2U2HBW5_9BURK|nr:MipA/OmpV family protein [Massilia glaciei]PWF40338.1 MipA/OmpV family protein [Massilia glaciei]
MNRPPLLLAALFAIVPATPAAAAAAPPVEPLWELMLGAGAASTPAYPGARESSSRAILVPLLIYRGKVFRSDETGLGARLLRTDRFELDLGFAGSLPSRSRDVAAREGMPDIGLGFEVGPRLTYRITKPAPDSGLRLELPLRAVLEASGGLKHRGWIFEPKLVHELRPAGAAWSVETSAGLALGNRAINAHFYGVRPEFATPTRPAYRSDAGLMFVRVGLSGSYRVNRDLLVFGFMRHDSLANAANRDSPLVKRGSGTSAGVALGWTLRRSSRPAEN